MKRNLSTEIIEGFEALAVPRLGQRAQPQPEVEPMTPPSHARLTSSRPSTGTASNPASACA
jgi:hypothetical protein